MNNEEFSSYDFLINDEEEVMLLLYERENEPKDSSIELNEEHKTAILHRRPDDTITLNDIPNEAIDSLKETDKLLICELSIEENEEDTQIVYAYEAEITD
ncbi:MAG: hypothetical protein E7019_00390 [Alphaproteobacteria bacterium]|nr:hypothetical protein [Alphaproteobacteria bacterium]